MYWTPCLRKAAWTMPYVPALSPLPLSGATQQSLSVYSLIRLLIQALPIRMLLFLGLAWMAFGCAEDQ